MISSIWSGVSYLGFHFHKKFENPCTNLPSNSPDSSVIIPLIVRPRFLEWPSIGNTSPGKLIARFKCSHETPFWTTSAQWLTCWIWVILSTVSSVGFGLQNIFLNYLSRQIVSFSMNILQLTIMNYTGHWDFSESKWYRVMRLHNNLQLHYPNSTMHINAQSLIVAEYQLLVQVTT